VQTVELWAHSLHFAAAASMGDFSKAGPHDVHGIEAVNRWVSVPEVDGEREFKAVLDYGATMNVELNMGPCAWYTAMGKKGAKASSL
jgi:hypothetical protein